MFKSLKKTIFALGIFSSIAFVSTPVFAGEWKGGAGAIYYMENGTKVTGWKQIDEAKYYFDSNGKMKKRWLVLGNDTYYLGINGRMVTGKQKIAGQTYMFRDDGRLIKEGQVEIGDVTYNIDPKGMLTSGSSKQYANFIAKYAGKAIDVDGNTVQCVDLAKVYINEVFGLPMLSRGDACKYYDDFEKWSDLKATFNKISASSEGFKVQQGDIVVWAKSKSLPFGHIAVGDSSTGATFKSYDQNWGSENQGTTLTTHTYSGVAGVLRPKSLK